MLKMLSAGVRRRPDGQNGGRMGGCWIHLCHFEDALWIQAASSHLPGAGDRALVCDGHDEAGHRAGLLLQRRIHHVPVAHLQRTVCEGQRGGGQESKSAHASQLLLLQV